MYTAPSADLMSGMIGALLTGSLIAVLFSLAVVLIVLYISYRVIRAGVRDGMVAATKKTGLDSAGASSFINGHPPTQAPGGAPPAPVTEYQGYRGPFG